MKREPGLLYTVIFTFIVCFVFVFILSLTNVATLPIVQQNEMVAQQMAILIAMGFDDINKSSSTEVIAERFQDIMVIEHDDTTLYRATVNGDQIIAKEFSGAGLWGTIYGVIGVHKDGNRISGVEIVSHNETPGLGGRIEDAWFTDQLRDERIVSGRVVMTTRRGIGDDNRDNGEIDGVSGATRTSEAVTRIINDEIENLLTIIGEVI